MTKLISDGDFNSWLSNPDKSHIKHNFAATAAPGVTNDIDEGYSVGSLWIDVSADVIYGAADVTDGAAVWKNLSAGAAGGDAWSDPVDAVITPDGDGTRDLATTSTRFATAYVDDLDVTTNIVVGGTVDGRDVATDGTKLDGIEALADVTDEANVTSALDGATLTTVTGAAGDKVLVQDASDSDNLKVVLASEMLGAGGGDAWGDVVDAVITPDADGTRDLATTATRFGTAYVDNLDVTTNIVVGGTVDGRDLATDGTKLDGVEALADVTDTANVTAAGALMDSELADIAAVKATTGTFLVADQSKLDGIEALADVTDTANVTAALDGATLTTVTGASGDKVLVQDASDSDNLKVVLASEMLGGDAWGDVVDAVITPDADGTRDLATTGTRFATAYVDDLDVTTNIVVGGTVDGRDIATDGTKLDTIDTNATDDQTAAEIRALGFFDTSNDGSASGLDADLLDGMDSDEFINAGLSTGTVNGGVLSVGTPNTTFSISDGTGLIVDTTTDPANPTLTAVSWTGKTNIAVTNLLTNLLTWVAIDSGGNVIQQTTRFTSANHRDYITLGVVVHVDKTIVDTVNNEHGVAGNVAAQISDVMEGLGFVNKSGNVFSANGANLNLNKSVGEIMNHGVNWDVDPQNPHHKTLAALTALTFQYRFQDGTNGATGIAVDPDIYDVGGTSTAVPTNKFTIQRINSFVSNNVKIQPGQTIYNSLADAKAAIQIESFVTEPSIESNGLLRGFLIVQEGCTDLTDTSEAFFLAASKFGDAAGAGGLSVTTLQAAYDNAVSNPEILTNSTNGAVAFRRGSAADTDTVVAVQDNAATVNFSVTGEGVVAVAGTVDGRDIATDGTKLDGIEALADVTDTTNVVSSLSGATLTGSLASTSTVDLGGATSLEIPNGAAPTVDAAGEIAVDTTITDHNGMIKYHDGVTEMVVPAIPVADLTANDNHIIKYDAAGNKFTMEADAGAGGGLADVVDDTTPQLGGPLDVNGQEIQSIGGTDIDIHSDNDVNITLGDAAGVDDFHIRDSAAVSVFSVDSDGAVTVAGTVDGRDLATDGTKLDAIEASADVTDTANVTAAGALMDSELADIAAVKATTAAFLVADETKLDGIEALADVTDATNVVSALSGATLTGALSSTSTVDLGGATSLEVPNSATPTVNADGEIALDTTVTDFSHGVMKYYGGEEMAIVALPVAELTSPTDTHVVTYNATNDEFELAAGGGGSIPESVFGGEAAAHSVNTTTAFAPVEYVDLTTVELLVRAFDDTTEEYMQGSFTVPADLDTSGTVTFEVQGWAKTVHASNNKVKFTLGHRAVADSEAMDGAYTDEDSGDLTTDSTQDDLDILTWTESVTNTGWVAGDTVHYRFSRIDASATELAGDYYVWKFIIRIPRA